MHLILIARNALFRQPVCWGQMFFSLHVVSMFISVLWSGWRHQPGKFGWESNSGPLRSYALFHYSCRCRDHKCTFGLCGRCVIVENDSYIVENKWTEDICFEIITEESPSLFYRIDGQRGTMFSFGCCGNKLCICCWSFHSLCLWHAP